MTPSTAIASPVDVVSTSEVSVSLTVDSNESIPALAADLAKLADVKYEGRKAIVCVVGDNLRGTPGIAASIFSEAARRQHSHDFPGGFGDQHHVCD